MAGPHSEGSERLQAKVVDARGEPVVGALVSVVRGSAPVPEIALLAGPEGCLTLVLPQGRFTLRAHGPDGSIGEAEAAVPTERAVVIRLRSQDEG